MKKAVIVAAICISTLVVSFVFLGPRSDYIEKSGQNISPAPELHMRVDSSRALHLNRSSLGSSNVVVN